MNRLRQWMAVACYAGCIAALTACGDDDGPSGTDAGEMTTDAGTGDAGTRDGGGDECEGRTLCTSAGTSCSGNAVVTCAEDADGCLVETRSACTGNDVCEVDGGTAACVDPCDAIPAAMRCDTDGARACDGDTLSVCAPNADGCLVRTETDCAAAPGGVCNPSGGDAGDMPVCAMPVDPCADVPADDRCTAEGTSCDGDSLVTCAPNAFGCLVETETDCASRDGGACDDSGAAAICTATDACAGITQCATEGTSCSGPFLVTCAPDAFGCLVETTADCTDAAFGFCDADATPAAQCSTAATDPCMGVTQCGTESSRSCSADTLEVCAPNAFGCFVSETTDCGATEEVCSEAGEAPACISMCPMAEAMVIDCASGTITSTTAGGTTAFNANACRPSSSSYAGAERVYRFRNTSAEPQNVTIVATRTSGSGDMDLFAIAAGDQSLGCSDTALECLDTSTGTTAEESVEFAALPGELAYVVYDIFNNASGTSEFTLQVTCAPSVCGNGQVEAGEACDDGNTDPVDGCDASCQLESGFICGGEPSSCYVAAPNATCAGARVVTVDATFTGEIVQQGGPRPTGSGCGSGGGARTLYYAVTVPPSTQVVADVDASFDAVLMEQTSCAQTGCSDYEDDPERITVINTDSAPVTRVFAVRPYSTGSGTFDISFTYSPLCGNGALNAGEQCDDGNTDDSDGCSSTCTLESGFVCHGSPSACALAAPNATCATAQAITADTTLDDVQISGGGPRPSGTGCGSGTGLRTLYYAVTIPAGQQVVADVPSRSFDLVVMEQSACSETACVAQSDSPERLTMRNETASPITRIFAVRPFGSSTTTGTFDLTFTYSMLCGNGVVNGGETCDDGNASTATAARRARSTAATRATARRRPARRRRRTGPAPPQRSHRTERSPRTPASAARLRPRPAAARARARPRRRRSTTP